jgi:hypothetical protein
MKRITAVAVVLVLASTSFAAKQKSSYWSSLKHAVSSTTTKTISGVKSVMHLGSKRAK